VATNLLLKLFAYLGQNNLFGFNGIYLVNNIFKGFLRLICYRIGCIFCIYVFFFLCLSYVSCLHLSDFGHVLLC